MLAGFPRACDTTAVKEITIQELHENTERWVKEAAENGGIVVTQHGKPAVILMRAANPSRAKWAEERLAAIKQMPFIPVDSGVYISEDRDRS